MLSLSDLCSGYALDNGLSNARRCFWSHGVVYVMAIAVALFFMSEKGAVVANLRFPAEWRVGLASMAAGAFAFSALLVINYAFARSSNIGYTSCVLSTTSVITLLLSVALFNKTINTKGFIGVFVTLCGVALVASCGNQS